MSTVSGVFPNAITPTFAATTDQAAQNRSRRENEAIVFPPVDEAGATVESRPTSQQQPGRLEAESQIAVTSRQSPKANEKPQNTDSTLNAEQVNEGSSQAVQRQQENSQQREVDQAQLEKEIALIRELATRDREVKAHEQAHQTIGGQYAGSMAFIYEQGPDGKRYAVGGEVPIDVSVVPGDPKATVEKAEKIRAAALAPAEPSNQDRQVAALASQIALEAQAELRQEAAQDVEQSDADRAEQSDLTAESEEKTEASSAQSDRKDDYVADENEERLQDILEQTKSTVMETLKAAYNTERLTEIGFNLDTTV